MESNLICKFLCGGWRLAAGGWRLVLVSLILMLFILCCILVLGRMDGF